MEAWLHDGKVVVSGSEAELQSLRDKGFFGSLKDGDLILSLCEALYLVKKGKLEVFGKVKRPLSFNGFTRKARVWDERFLTRFTVYEDIRSRGYITKAALKFGADFAVYERGKNPSKAHSKWLLFAVSADDVFNWREFSAMNRVAHSVKKSLMVGVVDAENDVTYYSINWVRP